MPTEVTRCKVAGEGQCSVLFCSHHGKFTSSFTLRYIFIIIFFFFSFLVILLLLLLIILTMASLRSGPIAPGIAFVTGGARGLGNAIAVSFAREGSKGIALVDIQDEKTFEQGKAAVTKYGTKVGCDQQLMCFHPLADHDDHDLVVVIPITPHLLITHISVHYHSRRCDQGGSSGESHC